MNCFKVVFFTVILGVHPAILYARVQNVMDVVDKGENFFLHISQKFKDVLCGNKEREMDTATGRGINILLCEDIPGIDPLADEMASSLDQKIFLSEETTSLSDQKIPQGMDFVVIRPKKFKMGSPEREKYRDDNEGRVKVRITKPFEIMTTEVTQMQWFDVMDDNPSFFKQKKYCPDGYRVESTKYGDVELCSTHPVESISWDMIQVFIGRMNKNRDDCQRTPFEAVGCYRLPTEAEWELAARGRTKTAYFFGNNSTLLHIYAWYWENSFEQTHGVGRKPANLFGLHDVHGNVWEWVYDSYVDILPGGNDPLVNDEASPGVIRGGSALNHAEDLRCASRRKYWGKNWNLNVGFRLAKTLQIFNK